MDYWESSFQRMCCLFQSDSLMICRILYSGILKSCLLEERIISSWIDGHSRRRFMIWFKHWWLIVVHSEICLRLFAFLFWINFWIWLARRRSCRNLGSSPISPRLFRVRISFLRSISNVCRLPSFNRILIFLSLASYSMTLIRERTILMRSCVGSWSQTSGLKW